MSRGKITHVTADLLLDRGACYSQVKRFERIFPDGLEVSKQSLARALDGGFARDAWNWAKKLDLDLDLSGANLSEAYLRGADLRGADLREAKNVDKNLREERKECTDQSKEIVENSLA